MFTRRPGGTVDGQCVTRENAERKRSESDCDQAFGGEMVLKTCERETYLSSDVLPLLLLAL